MDPTTDDSRRDGAAPYRGRLAPSPTGHFHLGHVNTFETARRRAEERSGVLVLRNDDLDSGRCKPEFVDAMYEDFRWFGFSWAEGPDLGGPYGPYNQSERFSAYREAWEALRAGGWVYPCRCSRKDIQANLSAPHEGEDEPLYPGTCRPGGTEPEEGMPPDVAWRFRVTEGDRVAFEDANLGSQCFVAGRDFGDFIVWRRDGLPSYHLAAVVDDAAMRITEVVRGADLLLSTARQLVLIRALGLDAPTYYHCPLVRDEHGQRLAKRHASLSVRHLRDSGWKPAEILALARERAAAPQPSGGAGASGGGSGVDAANSDRKTVLGRPPSEIG